MFPSLLFKNPVKPGVLPRTPKIESPSIPEEYLGLCRKLDLNISAPSLAEGDRISLVNFLWENDIDIYDLKHVERYMRKIANKARREFFWAPLRIIDSRYTVGSAYSKKVPIEMLRRVDLILSKFVPTMKMKHPQIERSLYFAVSDYRVPNPDPFIAVRHYAHDDNQFIVFGVWDEPCYSITESY